MPHQAPDLIGQALLDYQHGQHSTALTVQCSAADDEQLPAAYFFRTLLAMPELERQALDECRGRVLDLGAGDAGARRAASSPARRLCPARQR
jgi:hypothetical protein